MCLHSLGFQSVRQGAVVFFGCWGECSSWLLFSAIHPCPCRRAVFSACVHPVSCLVRLIGVQVAPRALAFLAGLRMRSVFPVRILQFARIVPSPSVPALLCLLVCRLPCVLCILLILSSGGLPCSLLGSPAEPLAPLLSGSGSSVPSSPMSHPLPELPADSSRIDALSKAAFWHAEMACHRSMVIAGHRGNVPTPPCSVQERTSVHRLVGCEAVVSGAQASAGR